jgi:hypothetical protein
LLAGFGSLLQRPLDFTTGCLFFWFFTTVNMFLINRTVVVHVSVSHPSDAGAV